MTTFLMLCCSAAVVLGLLGLAIRFDPAAAARRRRAEAQIRRGADELVREAQQLLRKRAR